VRKDDSFTTFEEVLQMAVEHEADFLLLGGDLFHDNKPSHTTVRLQHCVIITDLVFVDCPLSNARYPRAPLDTSGYRFTRVVP